MSESIDMERVRYIGRLSRIELTEEETAEFSRQFGEILSAFDKLQQLDVEGVTPMPHAVELTNVLADDQPGESLPVEAALSNAPQTVRNFYKVPKVLGEGS